MDETQGGARGQWMKHKVGNVGGAWGREGAMDETQGGMKGGRGGNG